ncbi:MAG: phosphoribosylformylglycinamidine synthase subunit PurL [Actinomycetota bacterium]
MKAEEELLHRRLGLTDDEYARIESLLGRPPNRAELAMYSVMWSEHCSYKSSRLHLKDLPSEGPHVLVGPGEGAGIIQVDDVAVAFRMESHNHPSYVEPVQGAATGIGGIVRDVLSVGARPVALLDPLRFGPLPVERRVDPEVADRNRFLVEGVVSGISFYGNCIGVPTVGGELIFEDGYSGNPLVNVMCIGVAPRSRLAFARAHGPGNRVLLLGSSTGRDGIGGVSVLASATFEEGAESKRPSVQVGDPFTEKLLIEACLELLERGLVVGIQDLGGAGLCCATSESAARAGTGMLVDLGRVPRREPGMEAFELLTSESQERMLIVVRPGDVAEALAICARWGLPASDIGEVTTTGRLEVVEDGAVVADIPADSLGDGPIYDRPRRRPDWLDGLAVAEPPTTPPPDLAGAILGLVGSPNIASKRWVWEQYDHQVMLGTVVGPGHDAAVLRLPGAHTRLAVTAEGNGRLGALDPYLGSMHTVAEAARNLSTVGAEPVAITNCLNFGSPERPEVMWCFTESLRGMADACNAFATPVTGGNVSFYNETRGRAIDPTPIVGMVGLLRDGIDPPPLGFQSEGDLVVLVGETRSELGGSEYARTILHHVGGRPPALDLSREAAVCFTVRRAVAEGILHSAHDCSAGGLAVALAECSIAGGIGAQVEPEPPFAGDGLLHLWLFSESASRILVTVSQAALAALQGIAAAEGVPMAVLGAVGGSVLAAGSLTVPVAELAARYESAFPSAMGYGAAGV